MREVARESALDSTLHDAPLITIRKPPTKLSNPQSCLIVCCFSLFMSFPQVIFEIASCFICLSASTITLTSLPPFTGSSKVPLIQTLLSKSSEKSKPNLYSRLFFSSFTKLCVLFCRFFFNRNVVEYQTAVSYCQSLLVFDLGKGCDYGLGRFCKGTWTSLGLEGPVLL